MFKVAGIIQTFLWLGGSAVVAALAGTIAWVIGLTNGGLLALLVVGFFFLSGALILIVLRNVPPDWYLFRGALEPAGDPGSGSATTTPTADAAASTASRDPHTTGTAHQPNRGRRAATRTSPSAR